MRSYYSLLFICQNVFILILLFSLSQLNGQNDNKINEGQITSATPITEIPKLDGDVLNDVAWQKIMPITNFVQQQPNQGTQVSEKTEVRIAYDKDNLYLSAVMYDSNADLLIVTDSRRDASLEETDAIQFIFDTYHDTRNGFVFGTNPIGIQYDAQVDNEGRGNFSANRAQGGTIGGFNLNWDGSWEVKTSTGDYGWSAEFQIPLKTLRFGKGTQKWGLNIQRNIRNKNERAFWSALPLSFGLTRLSMAGDLIGLDLKTQGNLKLIPYVLGQSSKGFNLDNPEWETDGEVGLDLKYSITPSLTLDATYNTDFAQVEVDEEQVNLDRFNLFFPEKRRFFLENAGLFSVGSPGEIDLFFSRRIGIGDDGNLVPIIGGVRLSGKQKNTNIGLLNMYTEGVNEEGISGNTFSIGRVNHEFESTRTSLGGIIVNRSRTKDRGDDYNTVYALDTKIGLGPKAQIDAFIAKSNTPGIDGGQGGDVAFRMRFNHSWNGWNNFIGYTQLGEDFNPEVGFLQRSAFKKFEALVFKVLRPKKEILGGLLEIRPHVSYRGFWDFEGFLETQFVHIDNHWVWKNGYEFHSGVNFTTEGVKERFEISEGVFVEPGTYSHAEFFPVAWTDRSKPISLSLRGVYGGFFGGTRLFTSLTMNARVGDKFNTEISFNRFNIDLPGGDFLTHVVRGRFSYSFTPKIFVQALVQYNESSDKFSTNLRLGWLRSANSGLFVVFNEIRDDFKKENQLFTVKYSHIFDLLR
ncbi:MAG: DUF5916 domain-containing protein [Saprospiraceae bacterium]